MTGENGSPITPDWQPTPHSLVLSGEDFAALCRDLEVPPEWSDDDPEWIVRGTN